MNQLQLINSLVKPIHYKITLNLKEKRKVERDDSRKAAVILFTLTYLPQTLADDLVSYNYQGAFEGIHDDFNDNFGETRESDALEGPQPMPRKSALRFKRKSRRLGDS